MSNERKPLLSDDSIGKNAHNDWAEITSAEDDVDIEWTDGFKSGHRKGQRVARSIYEAAITKDAALIQVLVDALGRWYGDKKGDAAIAAAEAEGFKPTEE